MENKQILINLCKGLEKRFKATESKHKTVTLNCGRTWIDEDTESYFMEIKIDGQRIFCDWHPVDRDDSDLEDILASHILQDVFNYGIMASKEIIDNSF